MEIDLTTPALLFSAISLIMLAYTNRFLSYAQLVRTLKEQYMENPSSVKAAQIANLRKRLYLTRAMQVAGIGSLIYILRHYPELKWSREESRLSASHCLKLCNMGIPMGLQCSITAIGSVVLQGAVNGLGSSIVAAQTAGSKAAQFLSVPLESIGTAMTTYASQNMGAHDLKRVDRGVNTALGIGCVYSVASFLILRVLDVPLISLFLESSEVEIMANARSFIFWNSVFYIPLAVLIIYRYTIQGLGYSGLAMFAGVAEMVARAMVGFWFVPLWGYFAACIASPVAWFFACFFLIPAYFAVRKRLMKENAYGVGD